MNKKDLKVALLCLLLAACGPKKSDEPAADASAEDSTSISDEENAIPDAATDSLAAVNEDKAASPAPVAAAAAAKAAADKNTYKDSKGRTVYTFAESPPTYAGGESEMNKYLKKNLKYPATDAEGTVFVSFVVGEDGMVTDSKVESGVEDKQLRDEALRAVNSMPKWVPGKVKGKTVPVKFTLPVTFKKHE